MTEDVEPHRQLMDIYRRIVLEKHPEHIEAWPLLSGYNLKIGGYNGWTIYIFTHSGNPVFLTSNGVGQLSPGLIGFQAIDSSNISQIREKIKKHYNLSRRDGVFLIPPNGAINSSDFADILMNHEIELGLSPMRIFLSHKGIDKQLVKRFKLILEALGFEPWLDEDDMNAGVELERSILQGFQDSCAAIFFVTPNFTDENFISTEINYAIQQKRAKKEKFSIITIVFNENNNRGIVPDLLKQYVWKEPKSEIEALQEIIKALPIKLTGIIWK